MTQPQAWTCSADGSRLQWRRTALVCPICGPLHGLPAWPSREADPPALPTNRRQGLEGV